MATTTTLRSVPVRRIQIAPRSPSPGGVRVPQTPPAFRSLTRGNQENNSNSASSSSIAEGDAVAGSNTRAIDAAAAGGGAAAVDDPSPAAPPPAATAAPTIDDAAAQHILQQQQNLHNADNFEILPPIRGVLNSPRSLLACTQIKIQPTELVQRPLNDFIAHGVPRNVAILRRDHFEKQRIEKIEAVRLARNTMPIDVQIQVQNEWQQHQTHQFNYHNNNNTTKQQQQQHQNVPAAAVPRSSSSSRPRQDKENNNNVSTSPAYFFGTKRNPNKRNINSPSTFVRSSSSQQRSSTPLSRQGSSARSGSADNVVAARNNTTGTPRAAAVTTASGSQRASRNATPIQRSMTPLSRNNTNNNNNNNKNSSNSGILHQPTPFGRSQTSTNEAPPTSPARDNHTRHASVRDHHAREVVIRAKMDRGTRELQNVQRMKQQEQQREVTIRKLLRDRLLETEKKRLDQEDHMAHAARQRKLRDLNTERARVRVVQKTNLHQRDIFQVCQAKEMYRSPAARQNIMKSDPDQERYNSVSRSETAQLIARGEDVKYAFK